MTTLREAAQQALEALLTYEQYIQPLTNYFGGPRVPEEGSASAKVDAAITALRAALAEPTCKEGLQVEPVAWRYKGEPWFDGNRWHDKFEVTTDERVAKFKDKDATPLYTAPPQRKPLTEDEIQQLLSKYERNYDMVNFARAIERAHGIK